MGSRPAKHTCASMQCSSVSIGIRISWMTPLVVGLMVMKSSSNTGGPSTQRALLETQAAWRHVSHLRGGRAAAHWPPCRGA